MHPCVHTDTQTHIDIHAQIHTPIPCLAARRATTPILRYCTDHAWPLPCQPELRQKAAALRRTAKTGRRNPKPLRPTVTWTPKVCRIIAFCRFWAIILPTFGGLGTVLLVARTPRPPENIKASREGHSLCGLGGSDRYSSLGSVSDFGFAIQARSAVLGGYKG